MLAVYDSGFGGLTFLKEYLRVLPEYDYLYLGDNARTPYGNRSAETIIRFSEEAVEYLFEQGSALINVACNSVSTLALRHLQEKYLRQPNVKDRKILGIVKPVVEEAVKVSHYGRIGVVGTRGTINSKAFETELHKLNPKLKLYSQACPLLVPLVEEDWHHKPEARMILKKYLRSLKDCQVDALILGCTHYPFMMPEFQKYMGKNVQVLNTPEITALSLKDYLKRHPEIESQLSKKGKRVFLTTDDPERFKAIGERFLGQPIKEIKKISLG